MKLQITSQSKKFSTTVTIQDIVHFPVIYLKRYVSVTGFCVRLQVEATYLGIIDTDMLCLPKLAKTPIGFIKPIQDKATFSIF
jgi:hypothetical protein